MREIKFRAWDTEEKKMVNWDYISGHWIANGLQEKKDDTYRIMQYTGLKDKNGLEIYESDKLRCEGLYITVIWENGGFHFISDDDKDIDFGTDKSVAINWEIIGNIYENKRK